MSSRTASLPLTLSVTMGTRTTHSSSRKQTQLETIKPRHSTLVVQFRNRPHSLWNKSTASRRVWPPESCIRTALTSINLRNWAYQTASLIHNRLRRVPQQAHVLPRNRTMECIIPASISFKHLEAKAIDGAKVVSSWSNSILSPTAKLSSAMQPI